MKYRLEKVRFVYVYIFMVLYVEEFIFIEFFGSDLLIIILGKVNGLNICIRNFF